jgi:hypothetical protein
VKENKPFWIVLALVSVFAGCGSDISVTGDCKGGSGGEGGGTVEPPKGCDASPYQWQDEVLYVCPSPLPFTEMNGYAFVQVGDFQFVNYRGVWVNSITRVCVKSIGPTPLGTVTQINFDSVPSEQQQVVMQPPWSVDGKVCADIAITVGAESVQELAVYIASYPPTLPTGQYQFEIESPSDITIGSGEVEPIVGDFPVKADVVTIVEG